MTNKEIVLNIIKELINDWDENSSVSEEHRKQIKKHRVFWVGDLFDVIEERKLKINAWETLVALTNQGYIQKYNGPHFPIFEDKYQLDQLVK
jgi:hypothetical protein